MTARPAVLTSPAQIAQAAADVERFFAQRTPQPYSRTILALGAMQALARMLNEPGVVPIQGPARELIGGTAFDLWLAVAPRESEGADK